MSGRKIVDWFKQFFLRLIVMISALSFIQMRDASEKVKQLCHRLL